MATVSIPAYLDSFVDDAAIFPPGNAPLERAVADHVDHRDAEYADLVGGFVVSDVKVADLAEVVSTSSTSVGPGLDLNLVVTGGAGAIEPAVTWVSRSEGLSLRAVEFALRDEEDLAHNAQRLIQVVDSMGDALDDVTVFAEPPVPEGTPTHGWLAALDELAAREIHLKFRTGGVTSDLFPSAERLAVCIEAALDRELPFKCTAGLHNAVRHRDEETGFEHHGFLNILLATRTSLDGGGREEVGRVLDETDGTKLAERVVADPDEATRTRRWFTSFGSCSVLEAHEDLVELGLCVSTDTGFGVDHLPFGVYSVDGASPRVGVRLHDTVVDAEQLTGRRELGRPTLNPFLALGPNAWREVREQLTERVEDAPSVPLSEVTLHLPFEVADYVDFYASEQHATNVGRIFRPDGDALTPNWKHLPIGYHGRAGTVVVSGTDVRRPSGQRKAPHEEVPTFGPSRRLDIEAELGFVVGTPSALGTSVPTSAFAEHVFGVTPLNDWSARDLQAWEYVPLGPFLGKSFATSISPVGHAPRRSGVGPRRASPARTRSRWSTCRWTTRPATTSTTRSCSTARWSAGRRTPPCTGRPRRCSRT